MNTYEYAIKVLDQTADYYHSLILEADDHYWQNAYETALDLLERVQGLEEMTLVNEHANTCEPCKELGIL
jgi:hypothetical protein